MERQSPVESSALERTLAYLALGLIALALVAIGVLLAATGAGVGADHGFEQGAWPIIVNLPIVALPLGFVLIIVLIVVGRRHRSVRGGR